MLNDSPDLSRLSHRDDARRPSSRYKKRRRKNRIVSGDWKALRGSRISQRGFRIAGAETAIRLSFVAQGTRQKRRRDNNFVGIGERDWGAGLGSGAGIRDSAPVLDQRGTRIRDRDQGQGSSRETGPPSPWRRSAPSSTRTSPARSRLRPGKPEQSSLRRLCRFTLRPTRIDQVTPLAPRQGRCRDPAVSLLPAVDCAWPWWSRRSASSAAKPFRRND